ncbi:histone-like nucleoid-structuring protein Lsr2 [Geodermatophilus poikilotrophus]|uniref:Lsr2 protein n=1 Tax=Geodermatophilus poikilotrophus TaxID=1333667 RepID=A0A1H9YE03_9ACTN|nr:Lsr2 family protein [Geodermatophilus poikilotrophus]SES67207.1 Lsr2 protein [Geodermatophilus poikilotrophus]
MAQQTVVRLVDDLDETVIEKGAGQTVQFGLDGTAYELDLTDEHADELREAFSRYVRAARKTGGQKSTASKPSRTASKSEVSPQAVREWAKANKVELSARGRIPQSVIDQFKAAGN